MASLRLVLMLLGLVCFFLAAIGITPPRGGNLMAAGLFLWLAATIIGSGTT